MDEYRYPNDVNALIVFGIVPESKLFLNQRVCNDISRPIVLGIVPTSELLSRSRVCNDVNPLIVLGIVPPMLLFQNNIYVTLPKLPIEDGNVPLNNEEETLIDSTLQ